MANFAEILQAVGDASDYLRAGGEVPNTVPDDGHVYAAMAELSDDDHVQDLLEPSGGVAPNQIVVPSLDEMLLIYRAMSRVHRFWIDPEVVKEDMGHEAAHIQAAELAGFRHKRYGVALTESVPGRRMVWCPFSDFAAPSRPVTKLELGTIVVAPGDNDMSDGDLYRCEAMGYKGAQDVGDRVLEANSAYYLYLPDGYIGAYTAGHRV